MQRHSQASTILKPLYAQKKSKLPKEKSFFADLIGMLSFILDLEEPHKRYHAWRTSIVATKMAEVMLPRRWTEVHYAALLHDIGIIGFADQFGQAWLRGKDLKIPGIWNHPRKGAGIVASIPGLAACRRLIQEHHEWYNGEGYPEAKRQKQIVTGSQIIRIADSFDFYVRIYSKPWYQILVLLACSKELKPDFPQSRYPWALMLWEQHFRYLLVRLTPNINIPRATRRELQDTR